MPVDFEYPDPSRVLGLSTSHYTDVVNWKVARENGIKFAYIKAQNGINNPVKWWKENYEGAKKEGIKVGGYTWLYPASVVSPGAQARKFAQMTRDYPCDLPWCVDYEWTSPANPHIDDLYGFVIPFEAETGKKPAIYTAPGYWNQFGSKNAMYANYPLWQAQYNHGQADTMSPWLQGYKFLQWTQTGKGVDYGVPTYGEIACELNYYNGTIEEFNLEFGEVVVPPPTDPPTGDTMYQGTVLTALNIRPLPNTSLPSLGKLELGDKVETQVSKVNGWWKLSKITRGVTNVPLPADECYSYEGANGAYIRTDSYTQPPTDPSEDVHVEVNIVDGLTTVKVNGTDYRA